jgi:hypothetical protein
LSIFNDFILFSSSRGRFETASPLDTPRRVTELVEWLLESVIEPSKEVYDLARRNLSRATDCAAIATGKRF